MGKPLVSTPRVQQVLRYLQEHDWVTEEELLRDIWDETPEMGLRQTRKISVPLSVLRNPGGYTIERRSQWRLVKK